MKYYAIADLHGRRDLLNKVFDEVFSRWQEGDKIIFLGDYIDRGPQSCEVIQRLMEEQEKDSNIICLKGNHEDMMYQTYRAPLDKDWWIGNGGGATLLSYNMVMSHDHLNWIEKLPIHYETEKQLFVHAGVPQWNMNLPPTSDRNIEKMMWMIYSKTDSGGWRGKHVVHGHHQFEDGPHQWLAKKGGRTDLDTWAYHTGRIVIGVFDDTQGHALEYIEVRA